MHHCKRNSSPYPTCKPRTMVDVHACRYLYIYIYRYMNTNTKAWRYLDRWMLINGHCCGGGGGGGAVPQRPVHFIGM